jgi:hypothetical protein
MTRGRNAQTSGLPPYFEERQRRNQGRCAVGCLALGGCQSSQAGGKPCYVIESIPKSRASFTRKVAWIDRASFLPLKEEYYDAQKELFRVFTADEVRDLPAPRLRQAGVDGVPTITKRTMNNVKSGHRTEVVFPQVRCNVGLTEEVFTERSLRRPPAQWTN